MSLPSDLGCRNGPQAPLELTAATPEPARVLPRTNAPGNQRGQEAAGPARGHPSCLTHRPVARQVRAQKVRDDCSFPFGPGVALAWQHGESPLTGDSGRLAGETSEAIGANETEPWFVGISS